jgi:hypothetical protein
VYRGRVNLQQGVGPDVPAQVNFYVVLARDLARFDVALPRDRLGREDEFFAHTDRLVAMRTGLPFGEPRDTQELVTVRRHADVGEKFVPRLVLRRRLPRGLLAQFIARLNY